MLLLVIIVCVCVIACEDMHAKCQNIKDSLTSAIEKLQIINLFLFNGKECFEMPK